MWKNYIGMLPIGQVQQPKNASGVERNDPATR